MDLIPTRADAVFQPPRSFTSFSTEAKCSILAWCSHHIIATIISHNVKVLAQCQSLFTMSSKNHCHRISHIVSMSHHIVGHCHSVSKMSLLASEPFNASFCWKLAISTTLFSDFFNYDQICNYFTIHSRSKKAIKQSEERR